MRLGGCRGCHGSGGLGRVHCPCEPVVQLFHERLQHVLAAVLDVEATNLLQQHACQVLHLVLLPHVGLQCLRDCQVMFAHLVGLAQTHIRRGVNTRAHTQAEQGMGSITNLFLHTLGLRLGVRDAVFGGVELGLCHSPGLGLAAQLLLQPLLLAARHSDPTYTHAHTHTHEPRNRTTTGAPGTRLTRQRTRAAG